MILVDGVVWVDLVIIYCEVNCIIWYFIFVNWWYGVGIGGEFKGYCYWYCSRFVFIVICDCCVDGLCGIGSNDCRDIGYGIDFVCVGCIEVLGNDLACIIIDLIVYVGKIVGLDWWENIFYVD